YKIKKHLESKGLAYVDVFDPNLHGNGAPEMVKELVETGDYDIVGMGLMHMNADIVTDWIRNIKSIARSRGMEEPLVLGGAQEGIHNYRNWLKFSEIDGLVLGFGEKPLEGIISNLEKAGTRKKEDAFEGVGGLAYKGPEGKLRLTPARPTSPELFREMTLENNPADLIPYEEYWRHNLKVYEPENYKARGATPEAVEFFTSSHCRNHCGFCSRCTALAAASGEKDVPVLYLSPEDMLEILLQFVRHNDPRAVFIRDDDLINANETWGRERALKFCRLVRQAREDGKIPFDLKIYAQTKARSIVKRDRASGTYETDHELVEMMRDAGFYMVAIGAESFSDDLLQAASINKKTDAAQNILAAQAIAESGMISLINIQLFPPEMTVDDFTITADEVMKHVSRGGQISILPTLDYLPGSDIAGRVDNGEYETEDRYSMPDLKTGEEIPHPFSLVPRDPEIRKAFNERNAVQKEIEDELRGLPEWKFKYPPQPVAGLIRIAGVFRSLGMKEKEEEVYSVIIEVLKRADSEKLGKWEYPGRIAAEEVLKGLIEKSRYLMEEKEPGVATISDLCVILSGLVRNGEGPAGERIYIYLDDILRKMPDTGENAVIKDRIRSTFSRIGIGAKDGQNKKYPYISPKENAEPGNLTETAIRAFLAEKPSPYRDNHTERVKDISLILAEKMGVNDPLLLNKIEYAALLHDAGGRPRPVTHEKTEWLRKSLLSKGINIEHPKGYGMEEFYALKDRLERDPAVTDEERDLAIHEIQAANSIHVLEEGGITFRGGFNDVRTAILFHHNLKRLEAYLEKKSFPEEEKAAALLISDILVAADIIENGINLLRKKFYYGRDSIESPGETLEWLDRSGISEAVISAFRDLIDAEQDIYTDARMAAIAASGAVLREEEKGYLREAAVQREEARSAMAGTQALFSEGRPKAEKPVIIAHRTASSEEAEEAIASGAGMMEVDVQMTKDDVLIAYWGKVDTPEGERCVYELTYDEIAHINNDAPLRIEDLFEDIAGRLAVDLDIKDWSQEIDPDYGEKVLSKVASLIARHKMEGNVYAATFSRKYMRRLKEMSPDITTGISLHAGDDPDEVLDAYIREAKDMGASGIAFYAGQLSAESVRKVHEAGLLVVANAGEEKITADIYDSLDMIFAEGEQLAESSPRRDEPDSGEREKENEPAKNGFVMVEGLIALAGAMCLGALTFSVPGSILYATGAAAVSFFAVKLGKRLFPPKTLEEFLERNIPGSTFRCALDTDLFSDTETMRLLVNKSRREIFIGHLQRFGEGENTNRYIFKLSEENYLSGKEAFEGGDRQYKWVGHVHPSFLENDFERYPSYTDLRQPYQFMSGRDKGKKEEASFYVIHKEGVTVYTTDPELIDIGFNYDIYDRGDESGGGSVPMDFLVEPESLAELDFMEKTKGRPLSEVRDMFWKRLRVDVRFFELDLAEREKVSKPKVRDPLKKVLNKLTGFLKGLLKRSLIGLGVLGGMAMMEVRAGDEGYREDRLKHGLDMASHTLNWLRTGRENDGESLYNYFNTSSDLYSYGTEEMPGNIEYGSGPYVFLDRLYVDPAFEKTGLEDSFAGRTARYLLWDLPFADFLRTVWHERGHQLRRREGGGEAYPVMDASYPFVHYHWEGRVEPYWKYTNEEMAVYTLRRIAGGLEATQLTADKARRYMLLDSADHNDSLFYIISRTDLPAYIFKDMNGRRWRRQQDLGWYDREDNSHLAQSDRYKQSGDIYNYYFTYNWLKKGRPGIDDNDLRTLAVWTLLDPAIYYSIYQNYLYLSAAEDDVSLPAFLPYTRGFLTPSGLRADLGFSLRADLFEGRVPFDLMEIYFYGTKGSDGTFYGMGSSLYGLRISDSVRTDMGFTVWEDDAGGVKASGSAGPVISAGPLDISVSIGYKDDGFVPGQPYDEGFFGEVKIRLKRVLDKFRDSDKGKKAVKNYFFNLESALAVAGMFSLALVALTSPLMAGIVLSLAGLAFFARYFGNMKGAVFEASGMNAVPEPEEINTGGYMYGNMDIRKPELQEQTRVPEQAGHTPEDRHQVDKSHLYEGLPEGRKLSIREIIAHVKWKAELVALMQAKGSKRFSDETGAFIESNGIFLQEYFDREAPVILRVPVEAVEGAPDTVLIEEWLNSLVLSEELNIYIEFYSVQDPDLTLDTRRICSEYGIEYKPLPEGERRRENTVSLFAAETDMAKKDLQLKIQMSESLRNSIIVPMGVRNDTTGIVRATLFGLRLVHVARDPGDREFAGETARMYEDLVNSFAPGAIKLTAGDILALAVSDSMNSMVNALKKIISALPMEKVPIEEMKAIFERAMKVAQAA
ncbi:MAG: hypothetical protein GF408_01415, partial [Candidatus Omnitrophica bacterium]|nr:hypothetical protein [Candidatus Omnitrophota bacterium]